MFDVIQIAKAEYEYKNAKRSKVVEGTIVKVPNIFDRTVSTIRTVLTGHRQMANQPSAAYRGGAAVAK